MSLVYIAHQQPFWFVESDLLADLLFAEIATVRKLRDQQHRPEQIFDSSEATESQRKWCFCLLAHGKMLEIISGIFAGRPVMPPRLSEEDSNLSSSIAALVRIDAPDWVLGMERVVDLLPGHLKDALPEPLRAESYNRADPVQVNVMKSAVETLATLDRLKSMIERVVDQQFDRLSERWAPKTKKSNHWLKGTKGLQKKHDFSGYYHHLTDKQQLAFSLKWEYEVGPTELASRMGINRKTALEHVHAAKRNIDRGTSNEKRRLASSKETDS